MLQERRRDEQTDDSDRAGQSEAAEKHWTSTRTEEIDHMAGIGGVGDERERPPTYRHALIEFMERRHTADGGLSEARREQLLREGRREAAEWRDGNRNRHREE